MEMKRGQGDRNPKTKSSETRSGLGAKESGYHCGVMIMVATKTTYTVFLAVTEENETSGHFIRK